ncbi:unnamed protein product [Cyclocybe aegerita]|uniref:Uncharacterized protein n=1 Tax=Cyclocybe aegerita TaxID=1973307 RepID=A0A8S0WB95_CYCAE|nr:unnamed protein product [Cyclocybe aegerita]
MSKAILEIAFFRPKQALPDVPLRAGIVMHDPRMHLAYYLYEDPGQVIPNATERTIPERTCTSVDLEWSVEIPITADTTVNHIRRVLRDLPKVDQRINPGGMFRWTFGNYVKRFLRAMEKEYLLQVGPYHSDEFYDRYLKGDLGDGAF